MNRKKLSAIGILTGILSLVVCSIGYAASLTLSVESVSSSSGSEAVVPIQIRGANDVGAVQFDLMYDGALLTPLKVEVGALAASSLLEFNSDTPGRLAIGVVTVDPIHGDGELARAQFKINAEAGQVIDLDLQNALAWDETNLLPIHVNAEAGQISVTSQGMDTGWLLWLGLALVALCCLGVLFVLIRRFGNSRRNRPAAS